MIKIKRLKTNKRRVHAFAPIIIRSDINVRRTKRNKKKKRSKLTEKSKKILKSLGYKVKK